MDDKCNRKALCGVNYEQEFFCNYSSEIVFLYLKLGFKIELFDFYNLKAVI